MSMITAREQVVNFLNMPDKQVKNIAKQQAKLDYNNPYKKNMDKKFLIGLPVAAGVLSSALAQGNRAAKTKAGMHSVKNFGLYLGAVYLFSKAVNKIGGSGGIDCEDT